MNYGGGSYKREGRTSLSSILLLIVFVSAAALIVTAVIWRPWFNDEATVLQAQPTTTVATDVVQQAPTETPIGARGP